MTLAHRVQLSRRKGSKRDPGVIVCDRSSKWGNPFALRRVYGGWEVTGIAPQSSSPRLRVEARFGLNQEAAARDMAVTLYRLALMDGLLPFSDDDVRAELAGKALGCWCKPGDLCHVDLLVKLANRVILFGQRLLKR